MKEALRVDEGQEIIHAYLEIAVQKAVEVFGLAIEDAAVGFPRVAPAFDLKVREPTTLKDTEVFLAGSKPSKIHQTLRKRLPARNLHEEASLSSSFQTKMSCKAIWA
jgi:hypothetical protein